MKWDCPAVGKKNRSLYYSYRHCDTTYYHYHYHNLTAVQLEYQLRRGNIR
jgi:hypothetical protein